MAHPPPDVYYIRRRPDALQKYLDDRKELEILKSQQSPQQKKSYKLFELTEKDREILERKRVVPRMQISSKDPFMNKPKRIWQNFHKPVASTSEIMESLEPYETRKQTENQSLQRFVD